MMSHAYQNIQTYLRARPDQTSDCLLKRQLGGFIYDDVQHMYNYAKSCNTVKPLTVLHV